jgi:hypothetical protein
MALGHRLPPSLEEVPSSRQGVISRIRPKLVSSRGNATSNSDTEDGEDSAAPPNVACKMAPSHGAARMSRGQAAEYGLLGICERGIDVLYQPVYCDAANITPHRGTSVEFDERCTTKGHYIDEFHSQIAVVGDRAILLSRAPSGGNSRRVFSVAKAPLHPS